MTNLTNISHFYFIGIGGIGMSALARYLHQQGKQVAGYDKVATALTQQLEHEGIVIHYQDDYQSIDSSYKSIETAMVIYTPAIPSDMDELVRFRESGISIIKRAQLLGEISKTMTCLAVAGTHGKTTTSAILAHILYQSGVRVTAFLGGIIEDYNTNFLCTGTDVMVVEADEFDRSFMQLSPDIAGITAMDPDHLDIYGDEAAFKKTFYDFAALVPDHGLIAHADLAMPGIRIGVDNGDYHAQHVTVVNGAYHFELVTPSGHYDSFRLQLPGKHNLSNAILAAAMAIEYGVAPDDIRKALASFPGVERRFTYRINTSSIVLIDDYAHHPTEIDAVHQAVREMYPDETVMAVFQPHLFSRTRDFMAEFAASLAQFDQLALLDIYPAREQPIDGVNSQSLRDEVCKIDHSPEVVVLIEKEDVYEFIKESQVRVVVMIGAGDIGVVIQDVTRKLSDL